MNVTVAEPKEDKSQRGHTDFEHSDYSWKPSGNRNSDHSNDRYNDRSNDRNSNRNDHRNGNQNSRFDRNSSYEQDGRYQPKSSQESAPKDVASELKSMLFALLNNQ